MSRRRTYKYAPVIEKEKPVKLATVTSHVVVPLLISAVFGVVVGFLSWWMRLELWPIIGILAFLLVFAYFLGNYMPSLLARETVSSGEADDDEYITEQRVTLDIKHWNSKDHLRSLEFLIIPDSLEISSLLIWAKAAVRGESLAVNNWTGFRRPFTRSQYEQWMDQLIRQGLVQDLGGNKGRVLTRSGGHIFMELIKKLG